MAGKPAVKHGLKDASQEQAHKRTRSSSLAVATAPQRVPLGPGKADTTANAPRTRTQKASAFKRTSRQETAVPVIIPTEEEKENDMDIEVAELAVPEADSELSIINEREVEDMVDIQQTEGVDAVQEVAAQAKSPRIWPDIDTDRAMRHYREVSEIQQAFEDEVDIFDTTMVSEYSDEIFKYMSDLEVSLSRLS